MFSSEKLTWMNNQYIRGANNADLLKILKEEFFEEGLAVLKVSGVEMPTDEKWLKIIAVSKTRLKKLEDFIESNSFFLKLSAYNYKNLIWKENGVQLTIDSLKLVREILESVEEGDFNRDGVEKVLMPVADERGRGELLWPLRFALSGQKASPSPFEIMDVLGKHESLLRIDLALAKLKENV